jgi:hypothetical protein
MMTSSHSYELTQFGLDEEYTFVDGFEAEVAATADVIDTPTSYSTAAKCSQRTAPTRQSAASGQPRHPLPKLQFLQLNEWYKSNNYDKDEPSYLLYAIEWKVCVNGKVISKDTEQYLLLVPTAHGHMFLKPKLENLLRKKVAQNRHVRCEETHAIVSVTGRSEQDLTKRFDDLDIDWALVQSSSLRGASCLGAGKKLRVELSFNYSDQTQSTTTSQRGFKRGSSATQLMFNDRAA